MKKRGLKRRPGKEALGVLWLRMMWLALMGMKKKKPEFRLLASNLLLIVFLFFCVCLVRINAPIFYFVLS